MSVSSRLAVTVAVPLPSISLIVIMSLVLLSFAIFLTVSRSPVWSLPRYITRSMSPSCFSRTTSSRGRPSGSSAKTRECMTRVSFRMSRSPGSRKLMRLAYSESVIAPVWRLRTSRRVVPRILGGRIAMLFSGKL